MPTVTRVRSPRDVRRFVDYDLELYAEEPLYAPPLRFDLFQRVRRWIHPAVESRHRAALFLVEDRGRVLGRISASADSFEDDREGRRTGSFGFLEAVDERSVFGALFGAAEEWLVEHGVHRVVGPCSFTLADPYVGFLVEGFDEPPTFGTTYSRPYYPSHVESLGYRVEMDLLSFRARPLAGAPPSLVEKADALRKAEDVAVYPLSLWDIWDDAKCVAALFNAALAQNWGFLPVTEEKIWDVVRELRRVVDPRIVRFAEIDGELVGCALCLPDVNDVLRACGGRLFPAGVVRFRRGRRNRTQLRGCALVVHPRFRRKGVASLLVCETLQAASAAGYREAELSWVSADATPMLALADRFARPSGKMHRVYAKDLFG